MDEAHRVLEGGSFNVWVYGRRQGLTLLANNALRGMTTNIWITDSLYSFVMKSGGLMNEF